MTLTLAQQAEIAKQAAGLVIKEERRRQKLTMRQLSKQGGVSLGYLSEIEGAKKEPSMQTIGSVCNALYYDLPSYYRALADKIEQLEGAR